MTEGRRGAFEVPGAGFTCTICSVVATCILVPTLHSNPRAYRPRPLTLDPSLSCRQQDVTIGKTPLLLTTLEFPICP